MVKFKKKCIKCNEHYVLVSARQRFPVCYECQKVNLDKKIKEPSIKKLFDIPEEFYKENLFLRDIKLNYLKFGNLTDKQIEAFKKTVAGMKKN